MSISRWLFYTLAYFKNPRWDTGISPPELLDFIAHHSPGKALDIGCGSGTNAITLAQHGWQVVGVDFIPSVISRARLKARKANVNVKFMTADASRLKDIGEPFDMILDIGCFHSLSTEEQQRYIHNLEHLLAPGGFFLQYTFLKNPSDTRPGVTNQDVLNFSKGLSQVWRQDGMDNNGRISAWFRWEKR
jgi:cyclopropane fatty-acyl-phospholipid synthase-like methyltransferase